MWVFEIMNAMHDGLLVFRSSMVFWCLVAHFFFSFYGVACDVGISWWRRRDGHVDMGR